MVFQVCCYYSLLVFRKMHSTWQFCYRILYSFKTYLFVLDLLPFLKHCLIRAVFSKRVGKSCVCIARLTYLTSSNDIGGFNCFIDLFFSVIGFALCSLFSCPSQAVSTCPIFDFLEFFQYYIYFNSVHFSVSLCYYYCIVQPYWCLII